MPEVLNLLIGAIPDLPDLFENLPAIRLYGSCPGFHLIQPPELFLEDVDSSFDAVKVAVAPRFCKLLAKQESLGNAYRGGKINIGRRIEGIPDNEQVPINPRKRGELVGK